MSRRKSTHYPQLPVMLKEYAESRSIDFQRYSQYHMRLMDGGYTVLDVWITARYWVMATDYAAQTDTRIVERGGEKGSLPTYKSKLFKWLDELFYAADKENLNG